MLDAIVTNDFCAPHLLVLLKCLSLLQAVCTGAPQPAPAVRGSVNNDAAEPAASGTVSDRQ